MTRLSEKGTTGAATALRRPFLWRPGALRQLAVLGSAAALLTASLAAAETELAAPDLADIEVELRSALAAKGPEYEPRTHLRHIDGRPKYLNRLILETSPYLVQHAHNPVDWRPWGPEALAAAKAENKPIFLSVGYATCHWCHVMEEESFDTEVVADALNRDFIAVKVDREQRPQIDQTYMLATMLLTQRGGWPNSVWLTPDGQPFYAGTYFPQAVFLEVLSGVRDAWDNQRPAVDEQAELLSAAIQAYKTDRADASTIDGDTRRQALEALLPLHNVLEGGFSDSVQFPNETHILFMLDHWRRTGSEAAFGVATRTLDAIVAGGIHDHIGGGFHRYTVDPNWRTPHFEKMLYNQAALGRALVEGWEATGADSYARAARRALDYVLRDMIGPDGAFYAAEDADSLGLEGTPFAGERTEGAFYTWSPEQAGAALGPEAEIAIAALGLREPPTLEAGPVAHFAPDEPVDFAALDPLLEKLRVAREARPHPLRDTKIIAGWNGLMIRALAEGGVAFDEPRYVAAAARAAGAVWSALWTQESGLKRLYTSEQVAPLPGKLDDYAWLALGFVALWDATGDAQWIERAERLAAEIPARFQDDAGRLKLAEADTPLGPAYENEDASVPAAESSALELFAQLAHRTENYVQEERGLALLAALSGRLAERPAERTTALAAAATLQDGDSRLRRALARGKVRAVLRQEGASLRLRLDIAEGWHVNADQTLQDELIATALAGEGVGAVVYPEAITRNLGFQDAPLALFEGEIEISAPLSADGEQVVWLTVQACSDEICLAPEETGFRLR